MSRLANVFQISIYSLAALSSAVLALAENAWFPASVGVPLAIAALFLAERRNTLRLNSAVANILGVLALLIASSELLGDNLEARLLSGAHLIVYLLWIVLFLGKEPRQYWWLLALSVLQVAVASVLTTDAWFGAVLVAYFFCAIWTLSVFTLFRSQLRFDFKEDLPQTDGHAVRRPEDSVALITMGRMLRGAGSVRGSIQSDSHERWVNLRFALGTIGWAFLAIGVAIVFFVAIPRVWIGRGLTSERTESARLATSVTGFTENVRLGDFGTILESNARVLEVRAFEGKTDEPVDVEAFAARLGYDEPLFRGAVLTGYENGRWRADLRFVPRFTRAERRSRSSGVRQEFRLQPIGTNYLFAIHPVQSCRLEGYQHGARLNRLTSTLSLPEGETPRNEVSYTVWSAGDRMQSPTIAAPEWDSAPEIVRAVFGRRPYGLQGLRDLAGRVAGHQEQAPPSDEEKARRLLAFLRDSGEYGYSLDASIQNASIDPIEDFLFYRKQGHCEYFASALTLMLRSVGVPARLVSGFKGGTPNRFTGAFEVEQRHAHAWVEAFLHNQWVVLDPTPSQARTQSVTSLGPRISTWRDFTSLMSGLWGKHVVGMSLTRQRDELYQPLAQSVWNWWESLKEGRIQTSEIAAGLLRFLTSPERWFSWQGGAVTFFLLLFLSGLVWLVRRGWRLIRRVRARYRLHARQRIIVEFYERFRRVCEACGLHREPFQTQREYATGVTRELNRLFAADRLDKFPDRLVDAFYRIRFGQEALDSATIDDIDARLSELERSVRERLSRVRT